MGFLGTYSAKRKEGKATLKDMLALRDMLSDDDLKAIPQCLYTDTGIIDLSKLVALSWGIERRENPAITLDEVAESIPATDPEVITDLVWKIVYFYTNATHEDIERIRKETAASRTEETPVNPTPSESSLPVTNG